MKPYPVGGSTNTDNLSQSIHLIPQLICSGLMEIIVSLSLLGLDPNAPSVSDWKRKDYQKWSGTNFSISKTFGEAMAAEIQKRGWNKAAFVQKTQLLPIFFRRIQDPEYNNPGMSTVVTMCIALELDLLTSLQWMQKLCGINVENEAHKAYLVLLFKCREMSVRECNEKLEEWGFDDKDFLGSRTYKKSAA